MSTPSAEPLVAGVDSSTQSTKVELRTLTGGRLMATGRAPHPVMSGPRSEQDPQVWWTALVDALGQVGDHLDRVVAVAVAAQQHGLVVVDTSGEVIRPAKLWNDTESAPQARRLREALDDETWARSCGSVPVPSFSVTKLAWLVDNEPGAAHRVARVMLPHDWLTWRLTGRHVTDRGDASGTGWWDPVSGGYRPDLLALVGGRGDWVEAMPRVLEPGEPAGVVTAAAAGATGLSEGTVVGPGTGDNMAAALGLGLGPGDVVVSLGTSGTVYAVSPTPVSDHRGLVAGFASADGVWLPLVCTLNATRVTDTAAAWLGLDRAAMERMALEAPPGSGGVVLVPYLEGERTPDLPGARGWWSGLTTSTGPAELSRSAFEGVVCGLLAGMDALVDVGVHVSGRMFLIGGGARSEAYRRITADLAGRELVVPEDDETVATGACVQAAAVHLGLDSVGSPPGWELGAGPVVRPAPDGEGRRVRAAYRRVAGLVAGVEPF